MSEPEVVKKKPAPRRAAAVKKPVYELPSSSDGGKDESDFAMSD